MLNVVVDETVADELVGCLSTRSGPVVLSPGLCVARVHVIALVISSEHGSSREDGAERKHDVQGGSSKVT